MAESKEFKAWHRIHAAKVLDKLSGQPSIEERVEKAMAPENIRVEVKDDKGRWVEDDA